ncbi:MAG: helix-turn-helix domain-containing protein, partial [Bacteroidota bacterium]
ASKLLMNSDLSISQVCFESGYNNISYFNRKFKALLQLTPAAFRHQYLSR